MQLKQTGNHKQHISEFLRVSVMVSNLSEARRVCTFVKGLLEHLQGLVRSRKPVTLLEFMNSTKDL